MILRTKLRPAFIRPQLLARPRLLSILRSSEEIRLVVVHAEAGAGKSSLLFDHLHETSEKFAWYSLDHEDAQGGVFLAHLLHALVTAYPDALPRTRELLARAEAPEGGWMSVLVAAADELVDWRGSIRVVLDDYHLVSHSEAVREAVEFMLLKGPPALQVLLTTREEPRLPLPFLRSKGSLLEIRSEDLRFRPEEARQLFLETWKFELSDDLLEQLCLKTEGWVTGLQLVAQTLRGRGLEEARRYVAGLQQRNDHVYDYLASQVLDLQPREIQDFLLSVAVAERFNAPLASLLTGHKHPGPLLESLEGDRLFLIRLEDEWFRFHHLFRDFLRSHLARTREPGKIRELHRKAGLSLVEQGDLVAGIGHLLEAGENLRVTELLETSGSELLIQGQLSELRQWLDRLRCPSLIGLEAELLDLEGQWTEAVQLYQQAIARARQQEDHERTAALVEKLSLCYLKYGEITRLIATCEEGLQVCPDQDTAQRAMLKALLGATLVYGGLDWARGYQLLQESHTLAWKCGHPRAISWACLTYGFAYHFPQGNFQEALAVLGEGIEFFLSKGWSLTAYQLAMNKALVLLLSGESALAHELIEETASAAKRSGHVYVAKGFDNIRAIICLERGNYAGSQAIYSEIAEGLVPAQFKPWYYSHRMLLACHLGNFEAARVAGEEMLRVLALNGKGLYAPECMFALAYTHFRAGKAAQAQEALREALELAELARSPFWEMKCRLLECHLETKDTKAAMLRALELVRAGGYRAYILADPRNLALRPLLRALDEGSVREQATELLLGMGDSLLTRLEPLLKESGPTALRRQAVKVLGALESERAATLLREVVDADPTRTVRRAAGYMLQKQFGADSELKILTFGQFQVQADGVARSPRDFERPMVQRMLKYLLCRDGSAISDQVLEDLWPDRPQEKARHSLTQCISTLRRVLQSVGGDRMTVSRTPQGYRLDLHESVYVDVFEFERLVSEAWLASRQGERERALTRLREAEPIYGGDFLEDDLYEDWIERRRESLKNDFGRLLRFLAEDDQRACRVGEAIARYRRLLGLDPLDEKASEQLVACYQTLGDRSSAKREYERYQQALQEISPMEPVRLQRVASKSG